MERNILGDRKKPRYDETLVDKVNKQVAEEVARQALQKSSKQPEQTSQSEETPSETTLSSKIEITHPTVKTQRDWNTAANAEDKSLANIAELYDLLKKTNKSFSDRIKNCMKQTPLMTSTGIAYQTELYAKIKDCPGVTSTELIVPNYSNTPIEEVMSTLEGLRFIQELLITKDDSNSIQQVLSKLVDKDETIYVRTLDSKTRQSWRYGGVYIRRNTRRDPAPGISIMCTGIDVWEDKDIDKGFAILIKK